MEISDLIQIVIDPNLGVAWPSQIDFALDWYLGRTWRVEYTFSSPAVPVAALAVGNEVRSVWRYEVVQEGKQDDGKDTVTLRVTPERRGSAGYHMLVTYEKPSLRIIKAERFQGELKRPFEMRKLPPLEQAVARNEAGPGFVRTFRMQEPRAAEADATEAGGGVGTAPGAAPAVSPAFAAAQEKIFAGAEVEEKG